MAPPLRGGRWIFPGWARAPSAGARPSGRVASGAGPRRGRSKAVVAPAAGVGPGAIAVPVAAEVPAFLVGAGSGLMQESGCIQIQTDHRAALAEHGLDELRLGDVVAWDNRCTIHARTWFPKDEGRILRRCTIEGEPLHA